MNYYFVICNIKIQIVSQYKIQWNKHIQNFLSQSFVNPDEYYECIWTDTLLPRGILIYSDTTQAIFKNGEYEERLHFFWGQNIPCMLYREQKDKKIIYLNNYYKETILSEDNYCIFNALAFEKVLLKHYAVILHSSFIIWKGEAILFTAPSGTGKSTQAALWEKYEDAIIVNGDRAILKKKDDKVFAYGIPICGSSNICLNAEAPLRAIVYLAQYPENIVEKLNLNQKIKKLISETTINYYNRTSLEYALNLISDVAVQSNMYYFRCTKDSKSVGVLAATLEE